MATDHGVPARGVRCKIVFRLNRTATHRSGSVVLCASGMPLALACGRNMPAAVIDGCHVPQASINFPGYWVCNEVPLKTCLHTRLVFYQFKFLHITRFGSVRICAAVVLVSGWLAVTPSCFSLGKQAGSDGPRVADLILLRWNVPYQSAASVQVSRSLRCEAPAVSR